MGEAWKRQVARLGRLDTCAVSDALDRVGLPGAAAGLRLVSLAEARVAGRVITVEVGPRENDEAAPHLAAAAIAGGGPGEVIVIDNQGRTDVSSWGGILSHAAQQRGIGGVVVDGVCRDVDESRAIGFAVFARAAVPVTARGRIVQRSVNAPIRCGGVLVHPGDLVVADGSGVVFVPTGRAEEVLEIAEAITALEAEMTRSVRAGRSVVDVMHDRAFQVQGGAR